LLDNIKEKLNDKEGSLSEYLGSILTGTKVEDLDINGTFGHFIYNDKSTGSVREEGKSPIVYFLHGGPNSSIEKMFIMSVLIFLSHGYSLLIVNYPGSTGYGQNYLSSLNGQIGKLDVESCGDFLLDFLDKKEYTGIVDRNKVMLYGGSHGGYLSCWLSVHDKYAKLFIAAAIRNPVTDLVSSMATTDIPDWVLGQSTDLDVDCNYPPSQEVYNKMYQASPVFLTKNCTTPSLICLGKVDKRVSLFNGLYYYHAIKKNKCEAKLLVYPEDAHPLSSPETEVDCLFNILYWFEKYLNN
jgi:acylaminoacyl-peptidase